MHCIEPQGEEGDDDGQGASPEALARLSWRQAPGAWNGTWATTLSVTLMAGLVGGLPAVLSGCATPTDKRGSPAVVEGTQSGKAVDAPVVAAPAAPLPPAKTWDEYRERAARRLVEANPDKVYHGAVPEPLLAIPVLEIELKADGEIARINVMRQPTQAKDTVQIAIEAVKRGAPYGDVRKLPKPWKFAEVFLFDEDRKFKPRTLDQ